MSGAAELAGGVAELRASGVALRRGLEEPLAAFLALLAKWNRVFNLTAIRDPDRMVTHHVLDALAVLPHLPSITGLRLLDVGSGAGVPGIPLAIARPDWRVVLLDSNHKKGAFTRQTAAELGLANVETVIGRVEDFTPPACFDIVISRAFSDLGTFAQVGARLLAPGGRLIAMKGILPHEELQDLPTTVKVIAAPAVQVPGLEGQRHLVLMEPAA